MNMSNLTEQNEVINLTHIENHVSPHCRIDGISVGEHAKEKLYQVEIARLNAKIERLKTENVVMQVELDMGKQRLNNISAAISDFKDPMTKQRLCGLIIQIQRHLHEVRS